MKYPAAAEGYALSQETVDGGVQERDADDVMIVIVQQSKQYKFTWQDKISG